MAGQKQKNHLKRASDAWKNESPTITEVTYSTAVGLDLVRCKVNVKSINWTILNSVLENSGNFDIKSPVPQNHIKGSISMGKQPPLNLPGNEKKYSALIISYAYFSLRMLSSNIDDKGKRKGDIRQLTIHVEPTDRKLGNINNCSCAELQKRILEILEFLQSNFGIELDKENIIMNYFEINRNFPYFGRSFLSFFDVAFTTLPDRFSITPKYAPWGELGIADRVGIFARSLTVEIHVYNKVWETEDKYDRIYIDNMTELFRIEFAVKKAKQVNSWLTTNNPFELQEYMIEDAYAKYLKKYVLDPFNEQFERFYYNKLIKSSFFEGTQSKHWTDLFCSNLIYASAQYNIDMIFFTPDLIKKILREYTSRSQTIKSNLNRSAKLIVSKLDNIINDTDQAKVMKDLLTSDPEKYKIAYIDI